MFGPSTECDDEKGSVLALADDEAEEDEKAADDEDEDEDEVDEAIVTLSASCDESSISTISRKTEALDLEDDDELDLNN
jgi:hypothetical protein